MTTKKTDPVLPPGLTVQKPGAPVVDLDAEASAFAATLANQAPAGAQPVPSSGAVDVDDPATWPVNQPMPWDGAEVPVVTRQRSVPDRQVVGEYPAIVQGDPEVVATRQPGLPEVRDGVLMADRPASAGAPPVQSGAIDPNRPESWPVTQGDPEVTVTRQVGVPDHQVVDVDHPELWPVVQVDPETVVTRIGAGGGRI